MEEKQKNEMLANAGMLEQAYKMFIQQEARKEKGAVQKIRSKKKRRAKAKQARLSRKTNR